MLGFDTSLDDAADTLRFVRPDFDFDGDTDVTRVVDVDDIGQIHPASRLAADRAAARRLLIHSTRQCIVRLREAIAAGWDVGPELAHEEQRLAALEGR